MKQLDKYITHMRRMDAAQLVLSSNAPVLARMLDGGEKMSTQTIEHSLLVSAVQEAAPASLMADIRGSRPSRFRYPEDAPEVLVEVVPTLGAWRVTLSPYRAELDRPMSVPPVEASPKPALSPKMMLSGGDTREIERMLRLLVQRGASDLHLATGRPPMMRLHGEIKPLEPGAQALSAEALRNIIMPTMSDHIRSEYDTRNDTDYAYEIVGLSRFRANAFVDRKGPAGVFRRIPFEIIPAEELGLNKSVMELCNLPKGLVLVTGPTGSGKSTTLASMIDRINNTRRDHIITIEDPIEFVHKNKKCLVNQREVHVHTDSFKDALRAALREDPDVVLVGEMRDLETVAIAIETAETGHLVFGTLHTRTAPSTVDRIIDQFPADRQSQIRTMLSESLKGVIAQTLCKKIGGGRIAAYEVLIGTPAVANIIREGKTPQLPGVMQTSRAAGMQTLNDSLCDHIRSGKVDVREAWFRAVNKAEMRSVMEQRGIQVPVTLL